jgi:hypothetical protein
MANQLTADELLAGSSMTFTVPLPAALLQPGEATPPPGVAGEVVLRPLVVKDVERVVRAAKEQRLLTSVLMVQQALVAPKMTVDQVGSLPAGLVQFLLGRVNAISGLAMDGDDLDRAVKAPLAKACFVLAREFGWTPAECSELTLGQVLLYLEMIARDGAEGKA